MRSARMVTPFAMLALPAWLVAQAPQTPASSAGPSAVEALTEKVATGTVDLGYRWVSDVGGNFNTYRSIVNLGSGPKLMGLDLRLDNPGFTWLDRLHLSAQNWGGDPYNVSRLDAEKRGAFRLTFDYRNIDYFNYLPSFANTRSDRGILLNERSYDTRRRYWNGELELRPGKRLIPYLGFIRDAGFGTGITPFVGEGNEYPVANFLRDEMNNYRGGVRWDSQRFHLTLEQGGTRFKDDQQVFEDTRNPGNRGGPLLNQALFLSRLNQAYGVRGSSIYSKALVTASPFAWLDVHGQFLYSQPQVDVRYTDNGEGLFALGLIRFVDARQSLISGWAKQPRTGGSVSVEVRPLRRLRVVQWFLTDRFHNATSALLAEDFFRVAAGARPVETFSALAADRLAVNFNQQQVETFYDLSRHVTVRGGWRYVWGDLRARAPRLSGVAFDSGELRRHAGLAGAQLRFHARLTANLDYEGANGERNYYRASLQDFQKLRLRGRYQVRNDLQISYNFSFLDNTNPGRGIDWEFRSITHTASAFWQPNGGKRASILAEYNRSALRSNIQYLSPESLRLNPSFYRDNAHGLTALADWALPGVGGRTARLTGGGTVFVSAGSRPARYYQPLGRVVLPLVRQADWYGEWRWYGFTQPFYLFEAFRTHMFLTGLRFHL